MSTQAIASRDVIDADGHVLMEAAPGWLEYFPKAEAERAEASILDNHRHWYNRESLDKEEIYQSIRDRNKGAGGWDPAVRLQHMDEEGIGTTVLFGTEITLNQQAYSPAICRGYNDWLADFCATDRERLKAVALVPGLDPEAARKELRRCVEEKGFVACYLKASIGAKRIDDGSLDPIYSEAEGLGIPVLYHVPHALKQLVEENFGYDFIRSHVIHPFSAMLAGLAIVFGGLLERFPTLRLGVMEGQVSWLPWFASRMEEQYEEYAGRPGLDPGLARRPSETLAEGRLFFSCDPDEKYLGFAASAELGGGLRGEDCILWASDYPHSDCIFPGALTTLTEREDLTAEQKRKLTIDNARALLRGR